MQVEYSATALGKKTVYENTYNAGLLLALPRMTLRAKINIAQALPFSGIDIWNAHEFSWLNEHGKPQIAHAEFSVAADSINLIESKSFKLYLNSFHQTKFSSIDEVKKILQRDLVAAAQGKVEVKLYLPNAHNYFSESFEGISLDELNITVTQYTYCPDFLSCSEEIVFETLTTNLFKSNCPVTQQPDWASISIRYVGKKIERENLLKYLISYREHAEFHEQCVERIFMDISRYCQSEKLSVYARFTRRGGLDINPFRSNFESAPENIPTLRQ